MEIFELLFKLVNLSFNVEKVLKLFFNGGIGNGNFKENISSLEIGSGVVKFKIMNGEDVVGNEVVDESEHVD